MIDANELRRGNRISDIIGLENNLIVYKIEDGIITCGDDSFSYPYLSEQLKPIPLTPDMLENNCGFYVDNSKAHIVYNESGNIYQLNLVNGVFESSYLGTPIYFLHELQNHFLANTKKEINYTTH